MKNMKFLRKHLKLRQENVAMAIGVSRSAYAQYETDASKPDINMLKKLTAYFSVPISFLLDMPPFTEFERLYTHRELMMDILRSWLHAAAPDGLWDIIAQPEHICDFIKLLDAVFADVQFQSDIPPAVSVFPRFEVSEPSHGQQDAAREIAPCTEDKLLDAYRKLNARGKQKVFEYADDLLASGRYPDA